MTFTSGCKYMNVKDVFIYRNVFLCDDIDTFQYIDIGNFN